MKDLNKCESIVMPLESDDTASIDEARLYDIFFPVNKGLLKVHMQDELSIVLSYDCELTQEDCIALYRTGMEYLGWYECGIFRADQSCLVFEKPSKSCIVFMRGSTNRQTIRLYSGPKKKH